MSFNHDQDIEKNDTFLKLGMELENNQKYVNKVEFVGQIYPVIKGAVGKRCNRQNPI